MGTSRDCVARSVHLSVDGMDAYLSFTEDNGDYTRVYISTDQIALLLKLAASIISRCSIVRPVP